MTGASLSGAARPTAHIGSSRARRSVSELVLDGAQIIGLLDWDHTPYYHRLAPAAVSRAPTVVTHPTEPRLMQIAGSNQLASGSRQSPGVRGASTGRSD